jgi:hypothetical protein
MGVRYKGSQRQTKRTVELQEEEEVASVTGCRNREVRLPACENYPCAGHQETAALRC